jgi:hypothetical protein
MNLTMAAFSNIRMLFFTHITLYLRYGLRTRPVTNQELYDNENHDEKAWFGFFGGRNNYLAVTANSFKKDVTSIFS